MRQIIYGVVGLAIMLWLLYTLPLLIFIAAAPLTWLATRARHK